MQFKEWSSSSQSKTNDFLKKVVELVLESMRVKENEIIFSFPNYTTVASAYDTELEPAAEEPQAMRLAASVKPEPTLQENWGAHPLGKGHYAWEKLAAAGSPAALAMTPTQVYNFKRRFSAHLSSVAKEMGLIFELEIYANLLKNGIYSSDMSTSDAINKINAYYAGITAKTDSSFTDNVRILIEHHADEVGNTVLAKAKSILKCEKLLVKFIGGNQLQMDKTGSRVTSDMSITCGSESLGFSTKLTSESMVRVGDFWIKPMYVLLGGKSIVGFGKKLESLLKDEPSVRVFVVEVLETLLNKLSNNPPKLNFVINKILLGSDIEEDGKEKISNVIPTVRNYLAGRGGAEFSDKLKQDFVVDPNHELKLRIKPNSTVKVKKTAIAVSLNISNPSGTSTGTIIKFEVEADRVVVKMNNLY
jgi:hypothetical protein